jgi:hypothetical protein
MSTKWLIDNMTEAQRDVAYSLAHGEYQRGVLRGYEALSGSTLKGKAGRYRGKYQASLYALLKRLRAAGIPVAEERQDHGRRVLVLGAAD